MSGPGGAIEHKAAVVAQAEAVVLSARAYGPDVLRKDIRENQRKFDRTTFEDERRQNRLQHAIVNVNKFDDTIDDVEHRIEATTVVDDRLEKTRMQLRQMEDTNRELDTIKARVHDLLRDYELFEATTKHQELLDNKDIVFMGATPTHDQVAATHKARTNYLLVNINNTCLYRDDILESLSQWFGIVNPMARELQTFGQDEVLKFQESEIQEELGEESRLDAEDVEMDNSMFMIDTLLKTALSAKAKLTHLHNNIVDMATGQVDSGKAIDADTYHELKKHLEESKYQVAKLKVDLSETTNKLRETEAQCSALAHRVASGMESSRAGDSSVPQTARRDSMGMRRRQLKDASAFDAIANTDISSRLLSENAFQSYLRRRVPGAGEGEGDEAAGGSGTEFEALREELQDLQASKRKMMTEYELQIETLRLQLETLEKTSRKARTLQLKAFEVEHRKANQEFREKLESEKESMKQYYENLISKMQTDADEQIVQAQDRLKKVLAAKDVQRLVQELNEESEQRRRKMQESHETSVAQLRAEMASLETRYQQQAQHEIESIRLLHTKELSTVRQQIEERAQAEVRLRVSQLETDHAAALSALRADYQKLEERYQGNINDLAREVNVQFRQSPLARAPVHPHPPADAAPPSSAAQGTSSHPASPSSGQAMLQSSKDKDRIYELTNLLEDYKRRIDELEFRIGSEQRGREVDKLQSDMKISSLQDKVRQLEIMQNRDDDTASVKGSHGHGDDDAPDTGRSRSSTKWGKLRKVMPSVTAQSSAAKRLDSVLTQHQELQEQIERNRGIADTYAQELQLMKKKMVQQEKDMEKYRAELVVSYEQKEKSFRLLTEAQALQFQGMEQRSQQQVAELRKSLADKSAELTMEKDKYLKALEKWDMLQKANEEQLQDTLKTVGELREQLQTRPTSEQEIEAVKKSQRREFDKELQQLEQDSSSRFVHIFSIVKAFSADIEEVFAQRPVPGYKSALWVWPYGDQTAQVMASLKENPAAVFAKIFKQLHVNTEKVWELVVQAGGGGNLAARFGAQASARGGGGGGGDSARSVKQLDEYRSLIETYEDALKTSRQRIEQLERDKASGDTDTASRLVNAEAEIQHLQRLLENEKGVRKEVEMTNSEVRKAINTPRTARTVRSSSLTLNKVRPATNDVGVSTSDDGAYHVDASCLTEHDFVRARNPADYVDATAQTKIDILNWDTEVGSRPGTPTIAPRWASFARSRSREFGTDKVVQTDHRESVSTLMQTDSALSGSHNVSTTIRVLAATTQTMGDTDFLADSASRSGSEAASEGESNTDSEDKSDPDLDSDKVSLISGQRSSITRENLLRQHAIIRKMLSQFVATALGVDESELPDDENDLQQLVQDRLGASQQVRQYVRQLEARNQRLDSEVAKAQRQLETLIYERKSLGADGGAHETDAPGTTTAGDTIGTVGTISEEPERDAEPTLEEASSSRRMSKAERRASMAAIPSSTPRRMSVAGGSHTPRRKMSVSTPRHAALPGVRMVTIEAQMGVSAGLGTTQGANFSRASMGALPSARSMRSLPESTPRDDAVSLQRARERVHNILNQKRSKISSETVSTVATAVLRSVFGDQEGGDTDALLRSVDEAEEARREQIKQLTESNQQMEQTIADLKTAQGRVTELEDKVRLQDGAMEELQGRLEERQRQVGVLQQRIVWLQAELQRMGALMGQRGGPANQEPLVLPTTQVGAPDGDALRDKVAKQREEAKQARERMMMVMKEKQLRAAQARASFRSMAARLRQREVQRQIEHVVDDDMLARCLERMALMHEKAAAEWDGQRNAILEERRRNTEAIMRSFAFVLDLGFGEFELRSLIQDEGEASIHRSRSLLGDLPSIAPEDDPQTPPRPRTVGKDPLDPAVLKEHFDRLSSMMSVGSSGGTASPQKKMVYSSLVAASSPGLSPIAAHDSPPPRKKKFLNKGAATSLILQKRQIEEFGASPVRQPAPKLPATGSNRQFLPPVIGGKEM